MTPAERVVVETALRWCATLADEDELTEAVRALQTERAARLDSGTPEEDRTWGEVVESDEIYSAKTGRWYRVSRSTHANGTSKVNAEGLPLITKPSGDPVTLRRGATGQAADMFASVLWSMPVRPESEE